MNSKNEISFVSKKDVIKKNVYCPVCDSEQKSSLRAKVPHPINSGFLSLFECSFCLSYIYEDIYRVGYIKVSSEAQKMAGKIHYTLIGCGIDFGIKILSRIYDKGVQKTLLEIGSITSTVELLFCLQDVKKNIEKIMIVLNKSK